MFQNHHRQHKQQKLLQGLILLGQQMNMCRALCTLFVEAQMA
jgi:hypothetical protein